MKKMMLVTAAVIGFTVAHAQTNTTTVTTGNSKAVSHRPTVEVRAERSALRLKEELKLSDAQYNQVYTTKLAAFTKIEDATNNNVDDATLTATVKDAHTDYMKGMKSALNADQYKTWQASVAQRYDRWKTAATAQPGSPKVDMEKAKLRLEIEN